MPTTHLKTLLDAVVHEMQPGKSYLIAVATPASQEQIRMLSDALQGKGFDAFIVNADLAVAEDLQKAKRAQAEKERDEMREELKPLRGLPARLTQLANDHAQNEAKMQKSIDDAWAEVAKLKAEKTKLEKLNFDLANEIEEARRLAQNTPTTVES